MNRPEVVQLVRYVHALSPAQPLDEFTADAWGDVFDGIEITLAEAKRAAAAVARRRAFIDPHHILTEARTGGPHSTACRANAHQDCAMAWCACICHPTRAH